MTHQLFFFCPHEEIDIFFEVVVATLGEPPFELVPEAFNAVGMTKGKIGLRNSSDVIQFLK